MSDKIEEMTDTQLDQELRDNGIDPDELGRKMWRKLLLELWASAATKKPITLKMVEAIKAFAPYSSTPLKPSDPSTKNER